MKNLISKIISPYLTYSAHIFKFIVNQVTMSALGLIVFVAYLAVRDIPVLNIIIGLFPAGFFWFLIYDAMFEFGHKDSVSIEAGKIKFDKMFGAKIFFFSYLPSLILILINIIISLFGANANGVTAIAYYILNAFNFGLVSLMNEIFKSTCITMVILCIPPLVFCTLGYYLGARDMPIRKILGIPIKNPEANSKRK